MKTIRDLLNLLYDQHEASKGKYIKFEYEFDSEYMWVTFKEIHPDIESHKIDEDSYNFILRNQTVRTEEEIQYAYWTVVNHGRHIES